MKYPLALVAVLTSACFTSAPPSDVPCDPDAPVCPSDQLCIRRGPDLFACEPPDVAPVVPYCGDGNLDPGTSGEACDDGNSAGGDGCSATCDPEPGFACDGTAPSVCTDVDECAEKLSTCATDATCTNVPGAYTCACNDYFIGDGLTCVMPLEKTAFTSAGHTPFIVPANVHHLVVKLWGAGGAGGGATDTGDARAIGGGGAFVTAFLEVTPGETLVVDVGSTGAPGQDSVMLATMPLPGGLGGTPRGGRGGAGGSQALFTSGPSGGGGGGYSAIWRDTEILAIAGGGGGAGGTDASAETAPKGGGAGQAGAAGGGSIEPENGGGGGTITGPGAGGLGTVEGSAGAMLQGGTAPASIGNGRPGGGGGGAGYFGGGSGASGSSSITSGGGGGGGSFAIVANAMFISASTTGTAAGSSFDPDCNNCGAGGSHASSGRTGRVIIRY